MVAGVVLWDKSSSSQACRQPSPPSLVTLSPAITSGSSEIDGARSSL